MIRNALFFLCGVMILSVGTAVGAAVPEKTAARMTDGQAIAVFAAAGAAYKAENFKGAAAQYLSLVDAGKENGVLYYNLGNIYFKQGDLGRAILNYERARRFIPRDGDLNYNYHYALAQMKEPAIQPAENWAVRLLNSFIQFYTTGEMVVILFVLGCLLGCFHLLSLYLKWPARIRTVVLSVLAAAWFLLLGASGMKWHSSQGSAVVVEAGEVKFEPRQDATTYFTLSAGTRIKVLNVEGNWAKIERLDGKMGWLPASSFQFF